MILTMDRWITAIKADERDIPQIEKVVQNKPADLQEGCNTRDATPSFIAQPQVRIPPPRASRSSRRTRSRARVAGAGSRPTS
jgi:hypothetical protein